jgi:hypothetical protein
MKLAIMQPYFFPYIGYFQLLNAVDKFIIFDDVKFINKGWINRNRILLNEKAYLFTLPLEKASQNIQIGDLFIVSDGKWKVKLLKTIKTSYKKAMMFDTVYPIIENIIQYENSKLSEYLYYSISKICEHLNIKTQIVKSSSQYETGQLKGQERIIEICLKEKARQYYNPIGGTDLYNKNDFTKFDIQLCFLKCNCEPYDQGGDYFVPDLSIIDVMMFNSVGDIQKMLDQFLLVTND